MEQSERTPEPPSLTSHAVECYRQALVALADCCEALAPQVGELPRQRIARVCQELSGPVDAESLSRSRETIAREIREYRQTVGEVVHGRLEQSFKMVETVETSLQTMTGHLEGLQTQLLKLAGEIEDRANKFEKDSLRLELIVHSADIRRAASALANEWRTATQSAVREIVENRRKLTEPVWPSPVSAATNLESRDSIEKKIRTRIEGGRPFCVARFSVAPEHHWDLLDASKETVVAAFAMELSRRLHPTETMGAWRETEVAVLFDAAEPAVRSQVTALASSINIIQVDDGSTVAVKIGCSVTASHGGETARSFLARVSFNLPHEPAQPGHVPEKKLPIPARVAPSTERPTPPPDLIA